MFVHSQQHRTCALIISILFYRCYHSNLLVCILMGGINYSILRQVLIIFESMEELTGTNKDWTKWSHKMPLKLAFLTAENHCLLSCLTLLCCKESRFSFENRRTEVWVATLCDREHFILHPWARIHPSVRCVLWSLVFQNCLLVSQSPWVNTMDFTRKYRKQVNEPNKGCFRGANTSLWVLAEQKSLQHAFDVSFKPWNLKLQENILAIISDSS